MNSTNDIINLNSSLKNSRSIFEEGIENSTLYESFKQKTDALRRAEEELISAQAKLMLKENECELLQVEFKSREKEMENQLKDSRKREEQLISEIAHLKSNLNGKTAECLMNNTEEYEKEIKKRDEIINKLRKENLGVSALSNGDQTDSPINIAKGFDETKNRIALCSLLGINRSNSKSEWRSIRKEVQKMKKNNYNEISQLQNIQIENENMKQKVFKLEETLQSMKKRENTFIDSMRHSSDTEIIEYNDKNDEIQSIRIRIMSVFANYQKGLYTRLLSLHSAATNIEYVSLRPSLLATIFLCRWKNIYRGKYPIYDSLSLSSYSSNSSITISGIVSNIEKVFQSLSQDLCHVKEQLSLSESKRINLKEKFLTMKSSKKSVQVKKRETMIETLKDRMVQLQDEIVNCVPKDEFDTISTSLIDHQIMLEKFEIQVKELNEMLNEKEMIIEDLKKENSLLNVRSSNMCSEIEYHKKQNHEALNELDVMKLKVHEKTKEIVFLEKRIK